jgi:hypothetical protein
MDEDLKNCGMCGRKRKIDKGMTICWWCKQHFNDVPPKPEKLTKEEIRLIPIRLFIWVLLTLFVAIAIIAGELLIALYFAVVTIAIETSWQTEEDQKKEK